MQWNDERQLRLIQEITSLGIFQHKLVNRESGSLYKEIAKNFNNFEDFLWKTQQRIKLSMIINSQSKKKAIITSKMTPNCKRKLFFLLVLYNIDNCKQLI